jgi:hypothetical protein
MPVILKNNASSTLATAITASDTAIVVADGSQFPALSAGEYFYATLVSPAGTTEIIKVTARVSNSLTVVRAQDGSSANSFQVGALVDMRVNAASINELRDEASEISIADAGGYYTGTNVEAALQEAAQITDAGGYYTATTVEGAFQEAARGFRIYDTPAALAASTDTAKGVGTIWVAGPYVYKEVASGEHLTTAGGVKLQVQLTADGNIPLAAFNITTDGTGDNSPQMKLAAQYAADLSRGLSGGARSFHPTIVLPNGRIRFTEAGTLTTGFDSGINSGLRYVGQGRAGTRLIYDNTTDLPADSHAASTFDLSSLEFMDLAVECLNGKRFILHQNGGGGAGTALFHTRTIFEGNFERYVDIQGSSLGSETVWNNVYGRVQGGGTFFYVASTNPQSVNHSFVDCTIAAYGGTGNAIVFHFNAGGTLRWYGGYSSLGDNAIFLNLTPPSGAQIGISNQDYTFVGWHPEFISGSTGSGIIVNAPGTGWVTFIACNFGQLPSGGAGHAHFQAIQSAQNASVMHFNHCVLTGNNRFALRGQVHVLLTGSQSVNLSSHILQADRLNNSNYLRPIIQLRDGRDGLPDQDWFALQTDEGEAYNLPPVPGKNASVKSMLGRAGDTGFTNGLLTGFNSTYRSFDVLVPIGSMIKSVTLHYLGPNGGSTGGTRKFKVENYDGSKTFIAEQSVSAGVTDVVMHSGAAPLMHLCDDTNNQIVRVYGQTDATSIAPAIDDYGYIVVEYY